MKPRPSTVEELLEDAARWQTDPEQAKRYIGEVIGQLYLLLEPDCTD